MKTQNSGLCNNLFLGLVLKIPLIGSVPIPHSGGEAYEL